MARSSHWVHGLVGLVVLCAAGCDSPPTYPKAHLVDSLQTLFQQDQLHTAVRFVDHTLAVQLDYPGSLAQVGNQIGVGPEFDEATRKVLTTIHRVLLSSDATADFYVLLMSDPKTPGAYLTIVRYMDDVRRTNANMLDTPEMFARTIFELNFVGTNNLTIDQYVPRDIRLEEFLSWQIARRIQHKLTDTLQPAGAAEVGRCGGEFRDGEFAFTLNVVPASGSVLDDATMREIFKASTTEIAQVLSSYHFNDFQSVRLIYPLTGRNLVLPKARLDVFR